MVVVVVLLAAGVIYWQLQKSEETDAEKLLREQQELEDLNQALEQTSGVDYGSLSNPLEDLPDINPLNRTNPFSGVRTNPF